MWTAIWVTVTASVMTLRSMRQLIYKTTSQTPYKAKESIVYTNYLVINAVDLPHILAEILHQLPKIRSEITIEILFMPSQIEFALHLPSSLFLSETLQSKLLPINPIWSTNYSPEYIIDDSEIFNNPPLAHQIILRSKSPNIAFLTTRGVKRTPDNYRVSGIDHYKWEKFVNKTPDVNPDLITHDRVYELIQNKITVY